MMTWEVRKASEGSEGHRFGKIQRQRNQTKKKKKAFGDDKKKEKQTWMAWNIDFSQSMDKWSLKLSSTLKKGAMKCRTHRLMSLFLNNILYKNKAKQLLFWYLIDMVYQYYHKYCLLLKSESGEVRNNYSKQQKNPKINNCINLL